MALDLVGCEAPRVSTKPKRKPFKGTEELNWADRTTDGYGAIEFAEDVLGLKLFPWQKFILLHGLEINEDYTPRFRTVVVEVARQNGKSLLMVVLALWHMYSLKSRTVIGTAQNLDLAEKAWKEAVALAQDQEDLAEMIPDNGVYLGHPKQLVVVHHESGKETTSEYRVASSTRGGARGFSGDLILLDELREHQTWDAWAAISNTMNARPKAQCWAFSNAPDALGVVLRYLRALAHRELGWPDGDENIQGAILGEVEALPEFDEMPEVEFDTGFYEYSMAPGLPRNDPQGLAQANPSLNHTEVTENCITYRALISGLRTSPAHIAEAEICCRETTMGVGGPFPEGSWIETVDKEAAPASGSKIIVCVEVSNRREQTFIARAGLNGDKAAVRVVMDKAGTDWVTDYLVENRKSFAAVVVRTGASSPVGALLKQFTDARLPVVEWKGAEIPAGHGQIYDRLRDKTIVHLPHPGLDVAATSAEIRELPGGGWVVDWRKSPTDTAALYAAVGAVWGLGNANVQVPRISGWDADKIAEWEKNR